MASKDVQRQAVVIIHGIGEQRPMDTLRGFVKALSGFDPEDSKRIVWTKPDTISAGFEHRMLTLGGSRSRPQTDVYELYWAHLADPTQEPTFPAWFIGLFGRDTRLLPDRFRRIKHAGFAVFAVVIALALLVAWVFPVGTIYGKLSAMPIVALVVGGVGFKLSSLYRGTISDVSRYFDPHPKNVKSRNEVRALGVEFLDQLHQSHRRYDRIVVCGHSMGSAIGYDILQHLWFRMHETHKRRNKPRGDAKKALYQAIKDNEMRAIPTLQSAVFEEQKTVGNPWRISDFITLGSPLAHADLILAQSKEDFDDRISAGELSACPPRLEHNSSRLGFLRKYSIQGGSFRSIELLNHRSAFAATRWTNIYFPVRKFVLGDPIGGPVAPVFGSGISDVAVDLPELGSGFRHLDYWREDTHDQKNTDQEMARPLTALQNALALEWVKDT